MNRSMRSVGSMSELAEFFNETLKTRASETLYAGKFVANKVSQVAIFMQTTKGRDKICSLIQYSAGLYEACIKNSNIPRIQRLYIEKKLISLIIAGRIRVQMKNGRKIFKFLKFLDCIRGLQSVVHKNKPLFYKVIMIITHSCNFFYYLLDHLIWGINVGVLRYEFVFPIARSEVLSQTFKIQTKATKDSFSLAKSLLKMLKVYFDYKIIYDVHSQENILSREIQELPNKRIMEDSLASQCCRSLLKSRKKRRIKQLIIITTFLRIMMLIKRLNLPGHQYINKIAYATSGLIITFVTIAIEFAQTSQLMQIKPRKSDRFSSNISRDEQQLSGTPTKLERGGPMRTSSSQVFQKNMQKHKSVLENILADDDSDEQ